MPDLGVLGLEFEIPIVIIQISAVKFVLMQRLVQKR